jgi:hypothetical protein
MNDTSAAIYKVVVDRHRSMTQTSSMYRDLLRGVLIEADQIIGRLIAPICEHTSCLFIQANVTSLPALGGSAFDKSLH